MGWAHLSNLVWDFDHIDFLFALDTLRTLSLGSCPVAFHRAFRRRVVSRVPHLTRLDDIAVGASDRVEVPERA